jgi:hypothetical protein
MLVPWPASVGGAAIEASAGRLAKGMQAAPAGIVIVAPQRIIVAPLRVVFGP